MGALSCSMPLATPTRIGVPTAPKLTGVDWMMSPTMTAAIAGNPSASMSGAATAAGVPKPEAPSMNEPNSQPMMIACTRRSAEMLSNPALMRSMAPEAMTVASSRSAPNTIYSRVSAMMNPSSVAAASAAGCTCQTNAPMPSATT